MIVASLLLILVAVMLLVLGLAGGSSLLLIGSIVASLLAAVALVVGARQAAGARQGAETDDGGPGQRGGGEDWQRSVPGDGFPVQPVPDSSGRAVPDGAIPSQPVPGDGSVPTGAGRRQPTGTGDGSDLAGADDATAYDEPPAQQLAPADAALVAQLGTDVRVIDGRPRYHLADCPYLRDQENEALPVSEAVELGFTPCGRCEPDNALLADARRS